MSQDQPQPPIEDKGDEMKDEVSPNVANTELPISSEEISLEADEWGDIGDEASIQPTTEPRPSPTEVRRQPTPPNTSAAPSPQEVWQQVQPALKTQTIQVLRSTIRLLEGAVEKLEAPPAPPKPPATSSKSTPPSTSATTPSENSATPDEGESLINRVAVSVVEFWDQSRPWREQVQARWRQLLVWVRSRLPESANKKLSDPALSGVIIGSVFILFWIVSSILSPNPAPQVAVAPTPPTPIQKAPSPASSPIPLTSPTPSPSIAPEIKAPEPQKTVEPVPLPTPIPSPSPTPTLILTPEQKLIAAIQDQVAEVSDRYADGLIRSVQANFKSSRLTVKVSNDWYSLPRSQQDQVAAEMLRRSQELDFSNLEITDTEGTLLARSPVVGSTMVILKRTNSSTEVA
jgi:hypothetical protein